MKKKKSKRIERSKVKLTLSSQSKSSTKAVSIAILGTVSSTSVEKATQRTWDEWISILNKLGANVLTHQEIVQILARRYKLNLWWRQQVTMGYEIHIGRKIPGQNAKGLYSMTVTKTFPVDQKSMWKILTSPEGSRLWLKPMSDMAFIPKTPYEVEGGIFGEIRTLKAPLRMRLTWQDSDWEKPTILQIYIAPRTSHKCLLSFQQDGLKTVHLKEQMRTYWQTAMKSLLIHLENARPSRQK